MWSVVFRYVPLINGIICYIYDNDITGPLVSLVAPVSLVRNSRTKLTGVLQYGARSS